MKLSKVKLNFISEEKKWRKTVLTHWIWDWGWQTKGFDWAGVSDGEIEPWVGDWDSRLIGGEWETWCFGGGEWDCGFQFGGKLIVGESGGDLGFRLGENEIDEWN